MKRGYTLIELLATIVILAVIFIIAFPITNYIIDYVRKESFKISVTNIGRAGDLTYSREYVKNPTTRELIFVYEDGVETSNVSGVTLDYLGTKPLFGNLVISKSGKVAASLHNGELCATKEFLSKDVVITDEPVETCIREMHLPRIFLVGDSEVFVEVNTSYADEYVTALTSMGEETLNIERNVIYDGNVVSDVDTSVLGDYIVSYRVIEEDKSAIVNRTVHVVDTIAPEIITPGPTTITVADVITFNAMAGVTASDNSLEAINVSASGSISFIPNTYIITYTAVDSSGNEKVITRAINVNDISAPVITLNGANPTNINVGGAYTELGATALDDVDGDLTSIIETSGTINTNIKGTQYIIYSVTDSSNNTSSVAREVNIIDNIAPTVTFGTNGSVVYAKTNSTTVSVTDEHSSISSLKYAWTTSTTAPATFATNFTNGATISTPAGVSGDYYLWIEAIDSEGNSRVIRTNVFKLDNTLPVLTIPGNDSIVISAVASYNLMTGVSVTDNSGESLSVSVSGNIAAIPGNYLISYSATDSSGNTRTVTRTITVNDVTAPVITLNGANPISIFVNGTYTELGATALDDVDGNVTASIITSGTVNNSSLGSYIITYSVTDSSGNTATRTRTVNVIDNQAPTVTFGTNGNATYAKTRSTTVSVTDLHSGVASISYLWNTSTTAPSAASITTSFTNGATIPTPAGVTGGYYLWIKARDVAGNEVITRTNVFNLDNTIPVITLNGSSSISIALGGTYTEQNATATDNIDGTITGSIVRTGTVNPNISGTYTINYNVTDSSGNIAVTVSRTVTVNTRTEYRYRDQYTSCDTCYNTCQNSQGASVSYSCSSGWTLSGSTCSRTTTSSASVSYSCSSGWTLSGSTCSRTTTSTASSSTTYSCTSGWTLSGSTCSLSFTATGYYTCSSGGSLSGSTCTLTAAYGPLHSCPSGYYDTGVDCRKTYTASWVYYSCGSGCSRSGSTCSCSQAATANTTYTCPGGCTRSGTTCTCNESASATATYSCPGGCTRSGTTCSCSESQSASSSYSCPGGWSLSGTTCYQSYSCNPYSCNCSSYWGSWSSWGTTVYTPSGTRDVETRIVTSI